MASLPIEVVGIGNVPRDYLTLAVARANAAQAAFQFTELAGDEAGRFRMHAYTDARAKEILDAMENVRSELRGYHPFIIAVIDAYLAGEKYGNLFGSHRAEKGLAVVTTANVPTIIVPADRLHSYFLYYLARYALSFLAPQHRNNEETRSCIFDGKVDKVDLLKSMKPRAMCDTCRAALLAATPGMSYQQFEALENIFGAALKAFQAIPSDRRPRVFIGSSSEGRKSARKVQEMLAPELTAVVWDQGTAFGLGSSTLEALERAVLDYDFAIFVFTPDDELHSRGVTRPVARDNVVFELGLFAGRLGRLKALVLNPGSGAVALPSDLLGIDTAIYDPNESNLAASLGPPCNRLRDTIMARFSPGA